MRFLALFLLCGLVQAQTGFLINPYQFCQGQITANTGVFDGSNDSIGTTSLVALSDAKTFTMSVWARFDGGDGVLKSIFTVGTNSRDNLIVSKNTNNFITILGYDSTPALVLDATSSQGFTASANWVHIYMAIDLANSSNRHIYFNGIEDSSVTWATYTDATLNLDADAGDVNKVGSNFTGTAQRLFAALAEYWFNDTYFNDPTKFRCPANHPISLGSTGNIPTGSAPVVYLSLNGSGNSWATDSSGNGNTFTVTGTLGSTTSP